jgi:hypothetical protein
MKTEDIKKKAENTKPKQEGRKQRKSESHHLLRRAYVSKLTS